MSGINFPPAMPPAGFNLNTAMAHFEEEKTFWASMYVVITPSTPRKLKKKRSREQRERDASCLGKVIRRYKIQGASMKQSPRNYPDCDDLQE